MTKVGKLYGRGIIQPSSLNKEAREVDVVFATETPVSRFDWEEDYSEVLSCEPGHVRMERIDNGLPLIDCHNPSSVFNQLGRSVKVWFTDQREMCATVRFSSRPEALQLFEDIEAGIVKDISVGYRVYKFSREEPTTVGATPIYRAIDWMPMEISFAPVQADVNSTVRTAGDENAVEIINNNQKRKEMTKLKCSECGHTFESDADSATVACPECGADVSTTSDVVTAEDDKSDDDDDDDSKDDARSIAKIRTLATQAEQKRLNAILASTRTAKLSEAFAIELYQSGKSIEDCRQAVIAKIAEKQPKPSGDITVGADAVDKMRSGIEMALLHRASPSSFKLTEQGRVFRGLSLLEMGKEMLEARGVNTRGMDKARIADMIFSRTHSTSDFPLLFENVMDKMLRADYDFMPEYWDKIARQTSNADFHAKGLYQVDSVNGMKEIVEGGEIKYTTMKESKSTIRLKSFGEGISFTRQALINDDLSALSIIPNKFVKDWDELRGDMVWGMLIDNVTMEDNENLFSTAHKNVISGAGSVLSEAGLQQAMLLFKKQTGLDGKRRIRVQPKSLIVPAELEITARKLMTAITASTTTDVNVFANTLDIIVEPRLTDATAWYLSADPNSIDGLYYSYLDGEAGLRVNQEEAFKTDTMNYAVRGDFGVGAVDYRGMVKSAGK